MNAELKLLREQAKHLRFTGHKYDQIARIMGVSTPRAWILANSERHRKNSKESEKKYEKRNRIALCDMEK